MTWKFRIAYKSIYHTKRRFRNIAFSKDHYTWRDAWHACIDEAIKGVGDTEVISSIESTNNIVIIKEGTI